MKSSREREEIEDNIKNMKWKDAIIDYSYRKLIGFNIPPSQIWLRSIDALLEDEMVIHHCHYSGHIYGYAHKSCNSKLRIQTEIPVKVYAHNASNFDLLFMVKGFKLSDYGCNKINITGTANNIKSVNIGKTTWSDTINFFPASLDALSKSAVKKEQEWIWSDTERILKQSCVAERYLKLSKKDKEEVLKIMLNKGAIPYDMFKNGSEVNYGFFPSKISFVSSLKQSEVDEEVYERMKKLWGLLDLQNIGELLSLYNYCDVIILTCLAENRFNALRKKGGDNDPKNYSSTCSFTGAVMLRNSKIVLKTSPDLKMLQAFEKSIIGGYTSTPTRLSFNSSVFGEDGITLSLPNEKNQLSQSKKIFATVFKVDQINQYGFAMTKALPKGGIRDIKVNEDFNIEEFLQNYDEKSTVGHMFCVNLESPKEGINLDLNTEYSPVFVKTEVSPNTLSPYQIYIKKKIGSRGKVLKIPTTKKVISVLGNQLKVYLFAESLKFLKSVGWVITEVSEHYSFLQDAYMKKYVTTNQNERKKSKNVVESDASKAMNNHLYGWLLRNNDYPRIKPIIDELKEAEDWMDSRGKEVPISKNPFGGASYRKMKIQQKYDEDMSKEAGSELDVIKQARKELIDENYQNQMETIKKQLQTEDMYHRKKYPTDPSEDMNEAMLSTKTRSVVKINTKNSVNRYILEDKLKLESTTRFIGSKVLAYAKNFIAEFVHEVVKIFNELTIKNHVKEMLLSNNIEEVTVMMTLTDTDSASFQFFTVCNLECLLKQNEIDDLILKILIMELKARLDLSDEFYDKFNVRTPQTKKEMGLFAFEQVGKKIKLCLASNPKEYVEVYDDGGGDEDTNFKHKGIRKDSKGMNLKEYAKKLEDLSWLKDHREAIYSSKLVQTRFKKSLGDIKMIALNKIALAQLNDKVYYFENGLMSLPHYHPDLDEIMELRGGKTIEELLSKEIEEKTLVLEDKITLKRKNLRYYSSIMNHVLPNGLTVKKHLIKD